MKKTRRISPMATRALCRDFLAKQTRPALTLLLLVCLALLQGCAAVAVGGVAATPLMAADRRTLGTFIEDEAIENKARLALSRDKELNKRVHASFTSYNTMVLVTGEAPVEEDRQAVIDIVKGVEKVTHVQNEMAIAAPSSLVSRSADSVTTAKVKTKMLAAKDLSGIHVKVVTENGVTYLMGLVSRAEADLATEIARQTRGVQKVVKLFEYTD